MELTFTPEGVLCSQQEILCEDATDPDTNCDFEMRPISQAPRVFELDVLDTVADGAVCPHAGYANRSAEHRADQFEG